MMNETKYLWVNGFQMAYSEAGQGMPLLFVHGYPLNRALWIAQFAALGDKAHLLAPDLRGHGDSQAVPGPYSMDLFADDLAVFLDAMGISEPVVFCGLSMGGYIAFAFFRRYPQRLRGLVLTATRATADTPEGRQARDQAAVLARQRGIAAIAESMVERLLSPRTRQEKPHLVEQVRQIMLRTSLEGILGDLVALKERPDSTPTLAHITVPTLILPGSDDALIPLSEAQAMAQAIPGATLQVIPGAGHLPNLEQPEAFNAALSAFLDQLKE